MNNKPPKKRILVVDDDETFRIGLKFTLIQCGYEPVLTVGGKIAQQLLQHGELDLVLSDINMPDGNGLELLKYVRERCKIPIILMTGLKSLIETRDAFRAGAVNFLAKPFEREELVAMLNAIFKTEPAAPAEVREKEQAYCRLSIDDFISGKEIRYDIYVKLSSQKFVKIAHGGSNLAMNQIQSYKDKGIEHLYMEKKDFKDYMGFSVKIGQSLKKSSTISRERKLQFIQQTSRLLLETAMVDHLDEELLEQGSGIVDAAVTILADSDAFFGLMDLMSSSKGDRIFAHSLAVSLYSSLIAIKLGWTSPVTQFYVTSGALFHDIGMKEIPDHILNKERHLQNKEERAIYETHPVRGAQILRAVDEVSDEIIWIVQQHHENESGCGFPFRLRKAKIYPLAKIVAVADEFCDAIQKEEVLDRETILKVLEQMVKFSRDVLDPGMIAALMEVFKFDIPQEIRASIKMSINNGKKT